MEDRVYDCIIIGAGPGGLQAAIYLGRYNRDVLLLDRSGGRTWHARHIENVLTHREISGSEIIERGMEQARRFNVRIEQTLVVSLRKDRLFIVSTADNLYRSRYVIAASGVYDILPPIKNTYRYLGTGYFTCVDCDGYKTTNKRLVVMGDHIEAINIALAMKQMFTKDITFIPYQFSLPDSAEEVLEEEGIRVETVEPVKLIGEPKLKALELKNGERIACDAIMASFGTKLNDGFLIDLSLKKDAVGFKYAVNSQYESSLRGLYIVGPLNTGQDQVVIAAGEGAVAAIDINKRLLEENYAGEEQLLESGSHKS
ncbi:MAG: NAD(P)/FAD-dependent oxidoreductase [Nitrospiraceae bacterium]|nr:NAD(P)/FAD-dependent oxidoreductase [Nitrospiraceae bacterium]